MFADFTKEVYWGNTFQLDLDVNQSISGGTLYFMAKRQLDDADEDALITAYTGSGITTTVAGDGTARLTISAGSWTDLEPAQVTHLYAEIKFKTAAGLVYTLQTGQLLVLPVVRQSVA
jgi:hypothetical protein